MKTLITSIVAIAFLASTPVYAAPSAHLLKDIARDQARIAKITAKITARTLAGKPLGHFPNTLVNEQNDLAGDLASLSSSGP